MKQILKEVLGTSIYLLAVLALTYLVIAFVGQRTVVHGQSMENTLEDGDNLIVDKITYRFHEPNRFDVIVFPYQYTANTYYIKRVIGLPGETVMIDALGNIYINGELAGEVGDPDEKTYKEQMAANSIYLGSDEYFVLGDNRNNSSDSRDPSVGLIKRDQIIGRAWLRIFPFDKIGFVVHGK